MKVSVLTPTVAGREGLLRRATFSVRWQTWNLALRHVVLDCTGTSPAVGFQRCLERAVLDGADAVMPLSDDDWLAPHAVETLIGLLDQADFASGRTLIQTRDGQAVPVGEPLSVEAFQERGFVFGGAHAWRTTVTSHVGGFDPGYPDSADYDLYWRIAKSNARVAFTPEILYFWTDHPDSSTNTTDATPQYEQIRARHL